MRAVPRPLPPPSHSPPGFSGGHASLLQHNTEALGVQSGKTLIVPVNTQHVKENVKVFYWGVVTDTAIYVFYTVCIGVAFLISSYGPPLMEAILVRVGGKIKVSVGKVVRKTQDKLGGRQQHVAAGHSDRTSEPFPSLTFLPLRRTALQHLKCIIEDKSRQGAIKKRISSCWLYQENHWTTRLMVEINPDSVDIASSSDAASSVFGSNQFQVSFLIIFFSTTSFYWSRRSSKHSRCGNKGTWGLTLTWPTRKTKEQSGSGYCKHTVWHHAPHVPTLPDTLRCDRAKQPGRGDSMERDTVHTCAHNSPAAPDRFFLTNFSPHQPGWI